MTLPIDARSDGAATMRDLSEEMHKVITRLENSLEELIEITCGDIFAALDSYEDVSAEALQQSIRRNMNMAVTSLRAGQAPTPAELDPAATTTTERFHSGVSIDQVIIAFRMSFSLIHSRFIDFSFERLAAPELIRGSQILTDVSDAFTVRAVQTFHQLVVESAVADAARRSTALRNVLAGDFTPGAEGLALQINPLEPYAAIRVSVPGNLNAEQVRRQLEESGGTRTAPAVVVIGDDNDCLGIVARRPHTPDGIVLGIGPFVDIYEMPVSDRVAAQSLDLAVKMGRTGVQGIVELNWRLAAAQAGGVDRLFRRRFLEPIEELGDFAEDLLGTVRAYLHCGGSVARTAESQHVHVNTVRYRISRFEELTGFNRDNIDDLIGLAWVFEIPAPASGDEG